VRPVWHHIALALWAAICLRAYGQEGEVTHKAVEDTFVQKKLPDRNNAKLKTIIVDGGDKKMGDKGYAVIFLKFRLDGGSPIWTKLRMKVNTGGHSQSSDAGRIHLVTGNWDEKTVTYANQPEIGREIGQMGKVEQGETIERKLDVDLAGIKELSLAIVPSNNDGAVFLSKDSGTPPELVVFYGTYAVVNNGPLKLPFTEGSRGLVAISRKGKRVGTLGSAVAQFERKGIGYKGAGVGIAEASVVKRVAVKVNEPQRCVIDVTVARTESVEMGRRFEATYEFTIYAGQEWFESKLLSVTNTDDVAYELRGHSYPLQPDAEAKPWCFPVESVAGWIGSNSILGAMVRGGGDVTLGLRLVDETPDGDLTQRLRARLAPGETWSGEGRGVIVFAGEGEEPRVMVRQSRKIREILQSPDRYVTGTILLTERKGGADGPGQE